MTASKENSRRISIVRFVMIIGVVLLHTPPANAFFEGGEGWFVLFQAFFQSAMFRTTVPVLTFISAYLLFSSNLDCDPVKLYKKKFKTLVVPFIVFNGLVLLTVYLLQYRAGAAVLYTTYLPDASAARWVDAAFGYLHAPINYPLNFLRDLIVLILLTPLFSLLVRNSPLLGLLLVALYFMGDHDTALVLRNRMPVMFYLGALAAVYNWNINILDKYAGACFCLFLGLCALIVIFKIRNNTYLGFLAPFLIWPASKLIDNTRVGTFFASASKYTFFIYIAHAPFIALSAKLYPGVQSFIPLPVYWLLTPVVVSALLIAIYKLAMKAAPSVFSTMVGASLRKGAPRVTLPASAATPRL